MENKETITFEIVEQIGVIASYETGWNKELNLISWNGGKPKYDIRDWDPEHLHMSRGITLHPEEMNQIRSLMRDHDRTMPRTHGDKDMER